MGLPPRCAGSRLYASPLLRDGPNLVERTSTVIFALQNLASSRTLDGWRSQTDFARAAVAALSMGLEGLVATVRANPKTPGYHAHGFARSTQVVQKLCVIAGVEGRLSEAARVELLMTASPACLRPPRHRLQKNRCGRRRCPTRCSLACLPSCKIPRQRRVGTTSCFPHRSQPRTLIANSSRRRTRGRGASSWVTCARTSLISPAETRWPSTR